MCNSNIDQTIHLIFKVLRNSCIQDTLSSRAALGLPAAFRPSASREQRYLAYKRNKSGRVFFDGGGGGGGGGFTLIIL